MVTRRAFRGALTGGFLAAPLAAEAQQAGKVSRVGYLKSQNLVLEQRFAEGRNDRLLALAAELVQQRMDLIVAVAEPAVLAAKNATSSVPIVMLFVGDPVGSKLVASLARGLPSSRQSTIFLRCLGSGSTSWQAASWLTG